jgi:hypothetical protein
MWIFEIAPFLAALLLVDALGRPLPVTLRVILSVGAALGIGSCTFYMSLETGTHVAFWDSAVLLLVLGVWLRFSGRAGRFQGSTAAGRGLSRAELALALLLAGSLVVAVYYFAWFTRRLPHGE